MNVLYCTDRNYAILCGVSMTSLFQNNVNTKEVIVYIAANDIGEEEYKLREVANKYNREIHFLDASHYDNVCKEKNLPYYKGKYSAYYRMLALNEIECDRLLYLDCDTIINSSLEDLWNIDMGNYPIAAVIDCIDVKFNYLINKDMENKYFNTGVMMFQINEWKNENYTDLVIDTFEKVGREIISLFGDQDILNYLFADNFYPLPIRYNEMWLTRYLSAYQLYFLLGKSETTYYPRKEILLSSINPSIFHFAGANNEVSPWYTNNDCPQNDRKMWMEYLRLTPWSEEKVLKENGARKMFCDRNKLVKVLPWMFCLLKKIKTQLLFSTQLHHKIMEINKSCIE